jgi:hypothetical protein
MASRAGEREITMPRVVDMVKRAGKDFRFWVYHYEEHFSIEERREEGEAVQGAICHAPTFIIDELVLAGKPPPPRPPLRLPFPAVFFEYKVPNVFPWEAVHKAGMTHVGILAREEVGDPLGPPDIFCYYISAFDAKKEVSLVQCANVRAIPHPQMEGLIYTPHFSKDNYLWKKEGPERIAEHQSFITKLQPVFLCLSLLQCSNIAIQDVSPEEKLGRAYQKRHGIPLSSYKTLVVTGKRPPTPRTEETTKPTYHVRQHLCRGHFATYTAQRPLFGKYVGTFWVPSCVKGSADLGTIKKDYLIATKKEGTGTDGHPN